MESKNNTTLTISTSVNATIAAAWMVWSKPEYIVRWNFASDDWCCPSAQNELTKGGRFSWRMESKDGSMGFDFSGTYKEVKHLNRIVATLDDKREVVIIFEELDGQTKVTEIFEVEDQNSIELQRQGWQLILDNFKKVAESVKLKSRSESIGAAF